MSESQRVIELTDLPRVDLCVADASVLVSTGATAYIAYDASVADSPYEYPVALVRLDNVAYLTARGPNDEAFGNHRFYSFGLDFYQVQELLDSPWVQEVLTMKHKDSVFTGTRGLRHLIFALKETTVDCIARSATCIGLYPDHPTAMAAAAAKLA